MVDTLVIVDDKEDDDDDEKQEEDWASDNAHQLHRAPHGGVLRLLEVPWENEREEGSQKKRMLWPN